MLPYLLGYSNVRSVLRSDVGEACFAFAELSRSNMSAYACPIYEGRNRLPEGDHRQLLSVAQGGGGRCDRHP